MKFAAIPKQAPGRGCGYLRLGIVAAACVVLAALLAVQALSSVLTRSAPAQAAGMIGANGLAREQQAARLFAAAVQEGTGQAGAARAVLPIARESVLFEPLTPKSYAVLALAQDDPVTRGAIIAAANRLNRRDLALQGLVLQQRLAEDDYEGAIATLDQILRVHPDYSERYFAVLLEALRIDAAAPLFPDILDGQSPWHRLFLIYAVSDPQARRNLAAIRGDLAIADTEFDRKLIAGLVEQGETDTAQALYAQATAKAARRSDGHEGDASALSWAADFPPFDWRLTDQRGLRAQPSRDGKRLELFAQSGYGGVVAQRILAPPRAPFTIATRYAPGGARRGEGVRMVLSCAGGRAPVLDEALTSGANSFTLEPLAPDCGRVLLAITARARSGEPALRGALDPIRIAPR